MNKIIFLFVLVFLTNCAEIPVVPVVVKSTDIKEVKPQPSSTVLVNANNTVMPEKPVPSVIASVRPTVIPSPVVTAVPVSVSTPMPVVPTPNSLKDVKYESIYLVFKDEYRVRFDKVKKEFFSRTGADVSSINNLFKQYDVTEIYDWLNGRREEEANAEYEAAKLIPRESTIPKPVNFASVFTIGIRDDFYNEFLGKLRKEPLVYEASENAATGVTGH